MVVLCPFSFVTCDVEIPIRCLRSVSDQLVTQLNSTTRDSGVTANELLVQKYGENLKN